MSNQEVNLNLRLTKKLRNATKHCANDVQETQAVFVRKAIIHRLIDEGFYELSISEAELNCKKPGG